MPSPYEKSINESTLKSLKEFLAQNPRIIILPHASPDGDAIGSATALYQGLKSAGVSVDIACRDEVPEKFRFVEGTEQYKTDFNVEDYDGVVFIDCGHQKMTKFHDEKPRIFSDDMVKINIDHHPSNQNFGDINFVITEASASCEILYYWLQALGIKITPAMATALLLGIYTDTGSFMHQNTSPTAYLTASELIKLGGNTQKIARNVFHDYELKTLRLWGKVLQNLHVTPDGAAIVGVEREDYESIGASREDLQGVVDYLNSMPNIEYSVMLSEDEKGNVKASLRTRNPEIDVKALAEKFGGGGHVKASGFMIPGGHLQKEIKWKIVQE